MRMLASIRYSEFLTIAPRDNAKRMFPVCATLSRAIESPCKRSATGEGHG
ncbi:TPA: hypothetical protein ACNMQV_003892 [Klebsiella pneumoniae]|nr:hypothetical protein [Klebsiella pneumoniae]MCQ8845015.1 hypothetical protein [Klebsiella sp. KJ_S1]AMV54074.1 hypothetical protein AOD72_25480 [Klebsiella pneumoniae subsp. pneumoniae]AMV59238.1 hypothetical protein AOG31_25235 [Klebsiella pneumoniae subsp. pneumoniae]AUJ38146.1 hypothetical protein BVU42_01355 [Klebsiella pneumoniae]AUJ43399.1 hypothetical protein BV506_01360 [Klebsiella pneumoniae]